MATKQRNLFTVIKNSDKIDLLTWTESVQLATLLKKIQQRRVAAGKKVNKYIVCNQDEPYAEEVWQTILKGEEANEKKNKN